MTKIVVVDIDGTIAEVGERLKYLQDPYFDWDKFYGSCLEDEPITNVCDLVKNLSKHYLIVYLTGRREQVREETEEWLRLNHMPMGIARLMRSTGDKRHDTDIKPGSLEKFLATIKLSKSNVAFILEDRNSMVAKWREPGYTCLQPQMGDF